MGADCGMTQRLTVLIPCKNEEANIGACLRSARKVADEVLVADSGSTDRTLELVRQSGPCRIIEREYINSGDFKNWAIPQAAHDWVLILDADERIPDDLAREIRAACWRVNRIATVTGFAARTTSWDTESVSAVGGAIACCVSFDAISACTSATPITRKSRSRRGASVRSADGCCITATGRTTTTCSVCSAIPAIRLEKWHREGRRASVVKLLFNMPLRFLHAYFVRGGFLDGLVGFQVCALTGFYSFMKQARLWQLQHGRPRGQVANVELPFPPGRTAMQSSERALDGAVAG
jgi:glycosyltransferase involved in cell wall biosynthesis